MGMIEVGNAPETAQGMEIERLVRAYDSPIPWRRKAARLALQRMDEAADPPLRELFEAENLRRNAHLSRLGPLLVFGFIASAFSLILNRLSAHSDLLFVAASIYLIVAAWWMLTGLANGYRRRHKRLARMLAAYGSVEAIGPLAEALGFDEEGIVFIPITRNAARRGLTRLLPRLRPHDRGLLTDAQWVNIVKALMEGDTEYTLAVLKAWEQVGDHRALPHVRRMAHGLALTDSAKRVREAAQRCLAILETRIAEETAPQTLLRPSYAAAWTSETLLRPASEAPHSPAQELLRVVVGEE